MKKIVFFALGASLLVACSKEEFDISEKRPEAPATHQMTVMAGEDETKTEFGGTGIIWSSGDKLAVVEAVTGGTDGGKSFDYSSAEGTTSDAGATMSFNVSLSSHSGATSYRYAAIYPHTAFQTATGLANVAVETPQLQNPSASQYDKAADFLISQVSDPSATQPDDIKMCFARKVAFGQMTIKNLGSDECISSVTFQAQKYNGSGYNNVILAGTSKVNFFTSAVDYGSLQQYGSITMDYSGDNVKMDGSEGAPVFFTSYPFALAANDKFTVIVETESKRFTKTVTLAGEKTLELKAGDISRFSVNMSGIAGEEKDPYITLSAESLSAAGTNSYGTVQTIDENGFTWRHTAYLAASGAYLQLNKNNSFLEIPIVPGTIKKIVLSVTNVDASSEGDSDKKCKSNLTFTCIDDSVSSSVGEEGTNTIELFPTASSFRNGRITASGALKIWSVKLYYDADPATLSSLDIASPATKTEYSIGEHISFDGKVRGTYSNSTIADVSSLVLLSGDTSTAGNKDVTLSYGGQSINYGITVSPSKSVTYTVESKTSVAASGAVPDGSSATYSQTYGTVEQMTSGNSISLTISGFEGRRISGAKVIVHSNSAGGAGSLSLSSGANTIASIDNKAFNNAAWNGAWSNSYVEKVLSVTPTDIGSGEDIVLTILASANSLYFKSLTLIFDAPATAEVTTSPATSIQAATAVLSGSYTKASGTITETGFIWGNTPESLSNELYVDSGSGTSGFFSKTLTGLTENTTYYYKAYVVEYNAHEKQYDYKYGDILSFTTLSPSTMDRGYLNCYEVPAITNLNGEGVSGTYSNRDDNWFRFNTTNAKQQIITHTYTHPESSRQTRNLTILYDENNYAPLWTAHAMNRGAWPDNNAGRNDSWTDDPGISLTQQPGLDDASQYSRGHFVASNYRQSSVAQNKQTFYHSNQAPQWQDSFNAGVWNSLEASVVSHTPAAGSRDTMYVVTGVLYEGPITTRKAASGTLDVPIPSHFYKCIMMCSFNASGDMTAASGCAYIFTNEAHTGQTYSDGLTSIDAIETRAGFDFFPNVPGALQTQAEAQTTSLW